jgi:phospholipid/cholesterol/gamma-HCH transport system substrate-binding protein
MENKIAKNNIRLGIFVTIGMLLLITAIYFIGNRQHLFSRTIRISGLFKDISGLQIGNNVRFSGINIGTIEDIVIVSDSMVRVDMILEQKTQKFIKSDAIAVIGSEGLMGNKVLNITAGSFGKKMIADNGYVLTKQLVSMDDIMVKMDSVAGNAVYITADLKGILANMHAGNGVLGKLFMDEGMANTIDQTLINVKKGTHTLNEDLEALQSNFLFKKGFKKKEEEAQKAIDAKIKEAEKAKKALEKAEKDAKKLIDKNKK